MRGLPINNKRKELYKCIILSAIIKTMIPKLVSETHPNNELSEYITINQKITKSANTEVQNVANKYKLIIS